MPGKLRSPSTIFILLSLKACHVFVCFQAIQGRVSIYKRKMVVLFFFFSFYNMNFQEIRHWLILKVFYCTEASIEVSPVLAGKYERENAGVKWSQIQGKLHTLMTLNFNLEWYGPLNHHWCNSQLLCFTCWQDREVMRQIEFLITTCSVLRCLWSISKPLSPSIPASCVNYNLLILILTWCYLSFFIASVYIEHTIQLSRKRTWSSSLPLLHYPEPKLSFNIKHRGWFDSNRIERLITEKN